MGLENYKNPKIKEENMSFKAFRSEQFSHTHENVIFDKLYDALNTAWKDKDDPLYLFGNFCVANAELDALILKRNAIIVIDFKDYGGKIKFSENNIWYADDTPIKGGNQRNPFLQIRTNKYTLLSELKKLAFKSSPNFGHISGLYFFHNPIEFDDSQLPVNISRWFYLTDLQNSLKMINAIVSPEIRFTNSDLETLINFLTCRNMCLILQKKIPQKFMRTSRMKCWLYKNFENDLDF